MAAVLPEAFVSHHSSGRLRIRIPSRRGEEDFFSSLEAACARWHARARTRTNPLTGSVLICADAIDREELADFGRAQGLFDLQTQSGSRRPVMHDMVKPVAGLDRSLTLLTGGRVDLASGVFLTLLGFGIYEIARGRWTSPPWYTAFWYAFGLVSMFVIEKSVRAIPG
jgi:hypothetical protein